MITGRLRDFVKVQYLANTRQWRMFAFLYRLVGNNRRRVRGRGNRLELGGCLLRNVLFDVDGDNNHVIVHSGSRLADTTIHIRGFNHRLEIGRFCAYSGELWLEDSGCRIVIGEHTTIYGAHLAATEPGSVITVGKECLFSQGIQVRTGDSHSIIDTGTNRRINPAQDVEIGDHVWIGRDVKLLKGSAVGTHSIIGTGSIVTERIPPNSLAVGIPAKVVRTEVTWAAERLKQQQ